MLITIIEEGSLKEHLKYYDIMDWVCFGKKVFHTFTVFSFVIPGLNLILYRHRNALDSDEVFKSDILNVAGITRMYSSS